MTDYHAFSNERLSRLIDETQETLAELKEEVERRREAAQDREIENLDQHMEEAELSLSALRDFVRLLVHHRDS